MRCIICNSEMLYYFQKQFHIFGLGTVEYFRCQNCGFVLSKTHAEMSRSKWESLNQEYHTYQGKDYNLDDPRWITRLQCQARVLDDAVQIGLLDMNGRSLDYACGDGKLSNLLKTDKSITLLKYDKYMPSQRDFLDDSQLIPESFDFIITTSVFEHFTERQHFDSVETLVSQNGVFGIHTRVCEVIPLDDSWFYLLPVHCAFHTNKSMSILFEQWGYTSSVYNVDARLWLWFKTPHLNVKTCVDRANSRPNGPFYVYKKGFVDYWK